MFRACTFPMGVWDTVWKLKNFSATQILREINFDPFEMSQKVQFSYFFGSDFWLWYISAVKHAQIHPNHNFECQKWSKLQFNATKILPEISLGKFVDSKWLLWMIWRLWILILLNYSLEILHKITQISILSS